MNKRETLLELIRVEYAKHGEATAKAVRLYCENRISKKAFDDAAKRGMEMYRSQQS
jgi:hypothetical protein